MLINKIEPSQQLHKLSVIEETYYIRKDPFPKVMIDTWLKACAGNALPAEGLLVASTQP
jgi:hypothetical protein